MTKHHGWDSFMGVAPEVTWGTGVHPSTKFMPILSGESLQNNVEQLMDESIRKTPSAFYQEQGTIAPGGDVPFYVYPEDTDTILKYAMGTDTPAEVETGAYDHVLTLADALPVGLSVEMYRGGDTFGYHGTQVNQLTLTSEINAFLNATASLLARDEELNPTGKATSPTYTAVKPFKWSQGIFKIDTVESDLLTFNVTLNNNLKEDKFDHGSPYRESIPRNGAREVTGTFRMQFEDTTQYAKFVSGANAALELVFTGALITGTSYYMLTISLPVVKFTGTTPVIEGKEIMEHDIPFTALENVGVGHEMTMTLRNSQATI